MARPEQSHDEVKAIIGWSTTQAYTLAVICLLLGVAIGYLLRGRRTHLFRLPLYQTREIGDCGRKGI